MSAWIAVLQAALAARVRHRDVMVDMWLSQDFVRQEDTVKVTMHHDGYSRMTAVVVPHAVYRGRRTAAMQDVLRPVVADLATVFVAEEPAEPMPPKKNGAK